MVGTDAEDRVLCFDTPRRVGRTHLRPVEALQAPLLLGNGASGAATARRCTKSLRVQRLGRPDPGRVLVAGSASGGAIAAILGAATRASSPRWRCTPGLAYGGAKRALAAMTRSARSDGAALGARAHAAMRPHARVVPSLLDRHDGASACTF